MSGHSKWSTIKRKKGALDSKRSKIFSRISKEITIAVKEGGIADPSMNPRLRLAIQNAKGVNMPKDNIERAINKAEKDASTYVEYTFEGYANGGVAVFVECLSDNSNRTVSSVRATFKKYNGSLGTNGSLAFIFDHKGLFEIKSESIETSIDDFELEIIDAGVEDVEVEDDMIVLTCLKEDFGNVQKKLEEMSVVVEKSELQRIPNNYQKLEVEEALKVLRLIDAFEENDDVQNVYHNLEMTDEIANAMD